MANKGNASLRTLTGLYVIFQIDDCFSLTEAVAYAKTTAEPIRSDFPAINPSTPASDEHFV